ncbi:hypothetical protein [Enterococcus mundtii]|uniref:hypothetical protein n=1 Tax=Enterococcus mundtii TaxID=53346 RepID=UPI0003C56D7B|nr:hypothetical protein [Enterococcus mundtii]MCA6773579.1 hypothetical protein [Enterococcus mundtii]QCJ57223.1 hypothetical protein DDJ96_11635 [Enterococcus mundtii]BAO07828.1 hypothetical protein EMQU_2271 [Enterococcus mundtii QU 25]
MSNVIQFFVSRDMIIVYSTVIIGTIPGLVRIVYQKCKVFKFQKMIKKLYIVPIFECAKRNRDLNELNKMMCKSMKRLIYLKEKELVFINGSMQFEMIRVVEFSLSLIKKIDELSKAYEFKDTVVNENTGIFNNEQIKQISYLEDSYDKKMNKYRTLSID